MALARLPRVLDRAAASMGANRSGPAGTCDLPAFGRHDLDASEECEGAAEELVDIRSRPRLGRPLLRGYRGARSEAGAVPRVGEAAERGGYSDGRCEHARSPWDACGTRYCR